MTSPGRWPQGRSTLASVDGDVRAHVRANLDALELARDAGVSEAAIRRIHDVACRPQLTHEVIVEGHVQDHVMAPGDYKHHPNHIRLDDGGWLATAPVALVPTEMAKLVELAASPAFAGLHPVAQAGWLHDAVLHVQPFADGNGRVARALAGGVLLRAASVPLVMLRRRGRRPAGGRGAGRPDGRRRRRRPRRLAGPLGGGRRAAPASGGGAGSGASPP